jgi:hypothetical protein
MASIVKSQFNDSPIPQNVNLLTHYFRLVPSCVLTVRVSCSQLLVSGCRLRIVLGLNRKTRLENREQRYGGQVLVVVFVDQKKWLVDLNQR